MKQYSFETVAMVGQTEAGMAAFPFAGSCQRPPAEELYIELKHFDRVQYVEPGLYLVAGQFPHWLVEASRSGQLHYKDFPVVWDEANPDQAALQLFWCWIGLVRRFETGLVLIDRMGNRWIPGVPIPKADRLYFVDIHGLPWEPVEGEDQELRGGVRLLAPDENYDPKEEVNLEEWIAYRGKRADLILEDSDGNSWYQGLFWL